MPQIFQVLRCYKCLAFQVHQTKKSNKFACKICDEKQSIKRHYGIGIAKDCRMHVQMLNKMRGEKDETRLEDVSDEHEEENTSNSTNDTLDTTDNVKKTSKWLSYIDNQLEETNIEEEEIVSETNHKNNKRWPSKNKFENYKVKKNIALKAKHCNVIEGNESDYFNKSIIDNNNTMHMFAKRPLHENEDPHTIINKVSKQMSQDMPSPRNHIDFKDNNLRDITSITNIPKLETRKLNKSSKWAQFIERDEDIGEKNCDDEEVKTSSKNLQPIFNLCNDSDIDDILDI